MQDNRLLLHEKFCIIIGSRNVYFQPPPNVRLIYPCIVYGRNGADAKSADNKVYNSTRRYQVTVITQDPDSDIPSRVLEVFDKVRYGSDYTVDNLYHANFDIFY